MTTTSPYVPLINGTGTAVVHGEVVRVSATNTFVRAQADSAPHLAGLVGVNGSGTVGVGGSANIFTVGAMVDVLLETGLTPVAGQTVYVSATVAGRGTNIAPGTAVVLGTIETVAQYARSGIVQIALALATGTSGGSGPQGAQGTQGAQGVAGSQGAQGSQGTSGAQGAQGAPASISIDSVNTTGVTLSGLASAAYSSGQTAEVATVGDVFRLQQSALAVDNITVVNASGKAGYQWVRLNQPNRANAFVAAWSVDPRGSDENVGTTDLTALQTLQELNRRLTGLKLNQSVTVRVLAAPSSTDTGTWTFTVAPGALVTFLGVLGPNTGPGGANDNTIHSGTVTGFVASVDTPGTTDIELTDSAIPVSWTASGLLAKGVLFKRTNGVNRNWYGIKDLGSKTLRISPPQNNGGQTQASLLSINDAYTAYATYQMPAQTFVNASGIQVRMDSLWENAPPASVPGSTYDRFRCWVNPASGVLLGNQATNCAFDITTSGGFIVGASAEYFTAMIGGCFIGTGAQFVDIAGNVEFSNPTFQGCQLIVDEGLISSTGGGWAHYDTTASSCITLQGRSQLNFWCGVNLAGFVGSGNTGKLVNVSWGASQCSYGFNTSNPPFAAGSSSDASPITIGATSYPVSALPTTTNTILSPGFIFPGIGASVTNLTALGALASASFNSGATCEVSTLKAIFDLLPGTATTTPTTIIAANGKSGYQWVRRQVPSPIWQQQIVWFVDPANSSTTASDENDGLTSATPLLTWGELARRIQGAVYQGSGQSVTCTLMSSTPENDVFRPDIICKEDSPGGTLASFFIVGNTTTLYTGSITGGVANITLASFPTTGDQEFADTAIPTSFTASGLVGKLWKRTGGTRQYAWIVKDLGSKTARCSIPLNTRDTANTFGGTTITAMAAAQTYVVVSLFDLPILEPQNGSPNTTFVVQTCHIIGNSLGTDWGSMPAVQYRLCSIKQAIFDRAQVISNCYAENAGSLAFGGPDPASWVGGAAAGTGAEQAAVTNGGRVSCGSTVPIVLQSCGFAAFHGGQCEGASFLQYDSSAVCAATGGRGFITLLNHGGSNNTGKIVTVATPGDMVAVTAAKYTAGATTDASPFSGPAGSFATPALASAQFATNGCGIMPV